MLSMRAMPRLPLLLIAMGLSSLAPSSVVQTSVPTSTKVPDSATAVGIAEKVLTNIYGKKVIESERPFTVVLSDGIWHVYGTLYCKNNEGDLKRGRVLVTLNGVDSLARNQDTVGEFLLRHRAGATELANGVADSSTHGLPTLSWRPTTLRSITRTLASIMPT